MKMKSNACVLSTLLTAMLLLTGCVTASSGNRASLQIYQPRILRLQAGHPVPTVDGIYTPQTDETWHSAAAYESIESQLINAAAALAQERNRHN
jgi:hypothetical protein